MAISGITLGEPVLEVLFTSQILQKLGFGDGIVACSIEVANTERIGFELLAARETQQIELATNLQQVADLTTANQRTQQGCPDLSCRRAAITLRRMSGNHVADFVGHDPSQFSL